MNNIFGRDSGYDIVPDPDEDITPLSIIDDSGTPIGDISDFFDFPADVTPPVIKKNEPKSDLSQVSVTSTDANLNIGILKNILPSFSIGSFSTSIQFEKANIAEMKFINVLSDSVLPVKIVKYIQKGSLTNEKMILDFIDEKRKTFLVFDIAKSNSFTITLIKSEDAESKTAIDFLKSIASVKGDAKIGQKDAVVLTYSKEKPLTFGTKQYPFYVEKTLLGNTVFVTGPHGRGISVTPAGFDKPPERGAYAGVDVGDSLPSRQEIRVSRSIQVPSFSDLKAASLKPARINSDLAFLKKP